MQIYKKNKKIHVYINTTINNNYLCSHRPTGDVCSVNFADGFFFYPVKYFFVIFLQFQRDGAHFAITFSKLFLIFFFRVLA